jgi:AcrR family transcriptional regulator
VLLWARRADNRIDLGVAMGMSAKKKVQKPGQARERLVRAAYELFTKKGIAQVGVDAIVARSGCAKASLYANFKSKDDLAIAYLELREKLWTRDWLEAEIRRRTSEPKAQLLAIFEIFDEWFRRRDFEGCAFINALLEARAGGAVRDAAAANLATVRSIVAEIAKTAGLSEPKNLARVWHILMNGAIISACEDDRHAAVGAQWMARLVLKNWNGGNAYRRPV